MLKQLAISYVQGLTAQCTVTYACRLVCSEGIQCPCSLERTANVPSVDTNYFKPWKKTEVTRSSSNYYKSGNLYSNPAYITDAQHS